MPCNNLKWSTSIKQYHFPWPPHPPPPARVAPTKHSYAPQNGHNDKIGEVLCASITDHFIHKSPPTAPETSFNISLSIPPIFVPYLTHLTFPQLAGALQFENEFLFCELLLIRYALRGI